VSPTFPDRTGEVTIRPETQAPEATTGLGLPGEARGRAPPSGG
jgi:hypothetical protein